MGPVRFCINATRERWVDMEVDVDMKAEVDMEEVVDMKVEVDMEGGGGIDVSIL